MQLKIITNDNTAYQHQLREYFLFDIPQLDIEFLAPDYYIDNNEWNISDIILACGNYGIEVLQKQNYLHRNKKLHGYRGYIIPCVKTGIKTMSPICQLYCTYALSEMLEDGAKAQLGYGDINTLIQYIKNGTFTPQNTHYQYVSDLTEFFSLYIKELYIKENEIIKVGVDIETSDDLYADSGYILSIQVSAQINYSDVVYFDGPHDVPSLKHRRTLYTQLCQLFSDRNIHIIGAGFKYDLQWIKKKWNIDCTNFHADTVLAGSILDENRSNGLKNHARQFSNIPGYETEVERYYDKSHMEQVPKDKFLAYSASDPDACLQIYNHFAPLINEDKQLKRYYQYLLHPASRAFEWIESNGICVDKAYYAQLREEFQKEANDAENRALSLLPYSIYKKHEYNLDLTRKDITRDYLFAHEDGLRLPILRYTEKTHIAQINKYHLDDYKNNEYAQYFIEEIIKYTKTKTYINTFVDGWIKHIRDDSRLHPVYMLHKGVGDFDTEGGAVSRLSCIRPNAQQIPAHGPYAARLRKVIIAPKDYVIIGADLANLELRLHAYFTKDPVMLDAYKEGKDLHALTGAYVKGISLEEFLQLPNYDWLRFVSKSYNFSLLYGCLTKKLHQIMRDQYGIHDITLEEADVARARFYELYKNTLPFHQKIIDLVKKEKQLRTPFGRIRHIPNIDSRDWKIRSHAERQALNALNQSTGTDICVFAIKEIFEKHKNLLQIFATIHDSIYAYVHKNLIKEGAEVLKNTMEFLPFHIFNFDILDFVSIKIDISVGENLAEMTKIK